MVVEVTQMCPHPWKPYPQKVVFLELLMQLNGNSAGHTMVLLPPISSWGLLNLLTFQIFFDPISFICFLGFMSWPPFAFSFWLQLLNCFLSSSSAVFSVPERGDINICFLPFMGECWTTGPQQHSFSGSWLIMKAENMIYCKHRRIFLSYWL